MKQFAILGLMLVAVLIVSGCTSSEPLTNNEQDAQIAGSNDENPATSPILDDSGPEPITGEQVESELPSGKTLYTDEARGYSVEYPSDWDNYGVKSRLSFYSPKESESDNYHEQVEITAKEIKDSAITIEDFTYSTILVFENSVNNYEPVESEDVTVGGVAGHKLIFSGSLEINLKQMAYWTIHEGWEYVIVYKADEDKFNEFLPQAQAIIDSFTLLN